jgi:hypothetical protein
VAKFYAITDADENKIRVIDFGLELKHQIS